MSELGLGRCVYLVITEPGCGAGATAARAWVQQAGASSRETEPPKDWVLGWVVAGDSAATQGYFPDNFDFMRVYSSTKLADELDVRVFPSHVILDRSGRVVEFGGGGFLPTRDQFRSDCSVDFRVANDGGGR